MNHTLSRSFFNLEKVFGSTYILLIYLCKPDSLRIGKLGWIDFKKGYYIYVGSAKNSMKKRLARHLTFSKCCFWHIDYLLCNPFLSTIVNIWIHREAIECSVAQKLSQNKKSIVVKKGFGSSDCHCITHLFRLMEGDLEIFNQQLSAMNFSSIRHPHQ